MQQSQLVAAIHKAVSFINKLLLDWYRFGIYYRFQNKIGVLQDAKRISAPLFAV